MTLCDWTMLVVLLMGFISAVVAILAGSLLARWFMRRYERWFDDQENSQ